MARKAPQVRRSQERAPLGSCARSRIRQYRRHAGFEHMMIVAMTTAQHMRRICILSGCVAALCLAATPAISQQSKWPDFMSTLRPGASLSAKEGPLPDLVAILRAGDDIPANGARGSAAGLVGAVVILPAIPNSSSKALPSMVRRRGSPSRRARRNRQCSACKLNSLAKNCRQP